MMRGIARSRLYSLCLQASEPLSISGLTATKSHMTRGFLTIERQTSNTHRHLTPFFLQPFQGQSARFSSKEMVIQTQGTPNPQSLMFLPGQPVMESGTRQFPTAQSATSSPLAERLFAIESVTGVFFGTTFITVTKQEEAAWPLLKPVVIEAIMEHYARGEPIVLEDEKIMAHAEEGDSEIVAMIKELLETRIRPAVQGDGGDIVFKGFDADTGVVKVKMMGACDGCPSSNVTLKSGIENMLKHYIEEITNVVEDDTPEEHEEAGEEAFKALEVKLNDTGA